MISKLEKYLLASNNNREKTVIQKANEIEYLRNLYTEYKKTFPEYLGNNNVTEMIAADLDVTISTVQRADRLNKIDPEIKAAIKEDKISPTNAQRLSDIDKDTQKEIAKTLLADNAKINKDDAKKIVDTEKKYKSVIEDKEREIEKLKKQLAINSNTLTKNSKQEDSEKNKIISSLEKEIEKLKKDKTKEITEIIKIEKTNIKYLVSSIQDSKEKILKDIAFLKSEIENAEDKGEAKKIINEFINDLKNIKL